MRGLRHYRVVAAVKCVQRLLPYEGRKAAEVHPQKGFRRREEEAPSMMTSSELRKHLPLPRWYLPLLKEHATLDHRHHAILSHSLVYWNGGNY